MSELEEDAMHESYVLVLKRVNKLHEKMTLHPREMGGAIAEASREFTNPKDPKSVMYSIGIMHCFLRAYEKTYPERVYHEVAG